MNRKDRHKYMNNTQLKLFDFVAGKHGDQKRKYTGTPYTDHLVEVAAMVVPFDRDGMYLVETALCHDLFEDTKCTGNELGAVLRDLRYSELGILSIQNAVRQLTDVYTTQAFPTLNRAERKKAEAIRLSKALPQYQVQTVKCADIISNALSIRAHDQKFWKVYQIECKYKLRLFKHACPEMMERAEWSLF
jgi:(p)ppGpp synthase/HD superfamily hydrolase